MSYVIITGDDIEEEVNAHISSGYSLVGGVSIKGDMFVQAVYKKDRVKKDDAEKDIDNDLKRFCFARNKVRELQQEGKVVRGLRKTNLLTPKIQSSWNSLMKALDQFDYKEGKNKYDLLAATVKKYIEHVESLKKESGNNYYTHRFSFAEFIQQDNGARKFINEVDLSEYTNNHDTI